MDMLINLVNILASDTTGMVYIGIGLMAIGMAAVPAGSGYFTECISGADAYHFKKR